MTAIFIAARAASVDRRRRASDYSSLIPASLIIFRHLAFSVCANAAKVARGTEDCDTFVDCTDRVA